MNTGISSETLKAYINSLTECCRYPQNAFQGEARQDIAEKLFERITSSQFRRSKVGEELAEDLRSKIQLHLKDSSPISFAIPFGAYKHWRTWSYPEPEWAEVFNISYMLRYAAAIAAAYSPGVALHYSYGDVVMDTVSNMPRADTERYVDKMKSLIDFFQDHAPENVKVDCVRINDFYTKAEHAEEFRRHYEDNVMNWERKYSEAERSSKVASALRNLMRNGVEDLSGLNEEQWQQRALHSAMWCDAHDSLERRRNFNKRSGHIQLGNIKGRRLELHVGSCDTSVHQFWVGVGLLEVHPNRFLQRILSQEKLDALKLDNSMAGGSPVVSMSISNEFMRVSEKYGTIWVLDSCSDPNGKPKTC